MTRNIVPVFIFILLIAAGPSGMEGPALAAPVPLTDQDTDSTGGEGVAPDTGVDEEWANYHVFDTTATDLSEGGSEEITTPYSEDLLLN